MTLRLSDLQDSYTQQLFKDNNYIFPHEDAEACVALSVSCEGAGILQGQMAMDGHLSRAEPGWRIPATRHNIRATKEAEGQRTRNRFLAYFFLKRSKALPGRGKKRITLTKNQKHSKIVFRKLTSQFPARFAGHCNTSLQSAPPASISKKPAQRQVWL